MNSNHYLYTDNDTNAATATNSIGNLSRLFSPPSWPSPSPPQLLDIISALLVMILVFRTAVAFKRWVAAASKSAADAAAADASAAEIEANEEARVAARVAAAASRRRQTGSSSSASSRTGSSSLSHIRECIKYLIMAEEYLHNPTIRCDECLRKNVMLAEGLADDAARFADADEAIRRDCLHISRRMRYVSKQQTSTETEKEDFAQELQRVREFAMSKYT
jgi:hypothetical protein